MRYDRCALCRNPADMSYFDHRICSSCFGKHSPAELDRRLEVKGQDHAFELTKPVEHQP